MDPPNHPYPSGSYSYPQHIPQQMPQQQHAAEPIGILDPMYQQGFVYVAQTHPVQEPALHRESKHIGLVIKQQPKEALVTQANKEKVRKPVDPPPVIRMDFPQHYDHLQLYTHSPYLYCLASLVTEDHGEQVTDSKGNSVLLGTVVSSVNRLKDIEDNEGAYFVFPDISVKKLGRFRILFSVYEFKPHDGNSVFLKSIHSNPFSVVSSKDYSGLEESTSLSRAFADQGVKLRLRKETRNPLGRKRELDEETEQRAPARSLAEPAYADDGDHGLTKRIKGDEEADDEYNNWKSPHQSMRGGYPPEIGASSSSSQGYNTSVSGMSHSMPMYNNSNPQNVYRSQTHSVEGVRGSDYGSYSQDPSSFAGSSNYSDSQQHTTSNLRNTYQSQSNMPLGYHTPGQQSGNFQSQLLSSPPQQRNTSMQYANSVQDYAVSGGYLPSRTSQAPSYDGTHQ